MALMKNASRNRLTDFLIIIINVLIVFGLFLGEFFYIRNANQRTVKNNKQVFIDTNVSLASMTDSYLVGESHLCRTWANYLNNEATAGNPKTLDDALTYVKESIVDTNVMCHIVYKNSLMGRSTRVKNGTDNDEVNYSSLSSQVFAFDSEGMNISSTYTNPINTSKSLAFYTTIKLVDPDNATQTVDAYLMRVVLSKDLRNKWVFPSGEFNHLELAIIDNDGKYIFSDNAFSSNDNFFEFYKSYNKSKSSVAEVEEIKSKVRSSFGSLIMNDYTGDKCFIAYSQVDDIEDWTLLTYIPYNDIAAVHNDWSVIIIIGTGLAVLFIFDLTILLVLNKNLKATAKEAESANKAKTDFLSTMSHDIRTPMNAIVGLTTIVKKDQRNPESTQDALRKIESASNHLLTLINDILDISKVESGKLSINPLSFSIVDTFENLVNISQPMIRAKNIDFSCRTHGFKHEWLHADKLRLSQIFTNLLSNAIKYTEEKGKVEVDIKELDSEKEGFIKLIFQVSDTGIGMSPEFIERMYQPFSRATDSRVNSIQGTGLGLAITKQMVDLMGGTIECQSELGKGTTFVVTIDLPISEQPNEDMMLPPIDVLVVDDDEILLQTAEDTLVSLGAKAHVATSGEQALEMIRNSENNPYRVVILDWKMPDMNGLELADKIREITKGNLPIILVSAYDWSEIEKEAKDAGINGFIFKPLFRSKIYQKIMDLLDHHETNKTSEEDEMNFPGTHILVVEDNDINWEIVSTLLGMHEIACDRAENGKVAYEIIKEEGDRNPYDLIFMDIQMPVMNGLDATRAIRKLDLDYARRVPIIAMTADAFSENVAECLEAGMNGHIAKPIDIKLVLSEIRKIIKNQWRIVMFTLKEKELEGKRTILIVDDEEINGDILSSFLDDEFEIRRAFNGQECLDIIANEHEVIDLIVLDVMMPVMDGIEVLRNRQKDPNLKKIPVIVMTSDKESEKQCFILGANDFIKKPYDNPDIIAARIKRMIELYDDKSIIKEFKRDKLTNLYSIDFFKKYANQFDLKYPDKAKDLLSIDVHGFHQINELYGRKFGDELLLEMTSVIVNYMNKVKGIAGCMSGEVILLYCFHQDDYKDLLEELNEKLRKKNARVRIGLYPNVDQNVDKDIAIGRAGSTRMSIKDIKACVAIFDHAAQDKASFNEKLVAAFDESLRKGEFKVFYQPKYNIQGEKNVLSSAEALVRWIHPEYGMISPGVFIPLFEANGLIQQLDNYIFNEVARQIAEWYQKYQRYIPVSVNISRVDIFNPNLENEIIEAVDKYNVPRSVYYLEITESAFGVSDVDVISLAKALRNDGFKMEIDDFGAGYSSLNMLSALPFDVLKIDMGFIRKMNDNPKNKEIIKLIIDITHRFDAINVAEGVESEDHYLFLKENGCDVIQGYYFSKPLPSMEFEELIKKETL